MADDADRSTPEDDAVAAEHVRLFDLHWERIVAVWPELEDGPANEAAWDSVCNLVPYGYVVVRRARFERLRDYAESAEAYWDLTNELPANDPMLSAAWHRYCDTRDALQPGDLDPLP